MKKTLCFAAVSAGALLAGSGAASAQEAPPAAPPATHPHTVAAGESLSDIARAELGTPDRWVDIFDLNRATLASPEVVRAGQVLDIPSPPVATPAPAPPAPVQEAPQAADPPPPPRPHTIVAGESLSRISQTELGTPDRWVEIFALNLATLPDPEVIEVGHVVDIPSSPVAVPAELLASLVALSAPAPAPVPAQVSSRQPVTTARAGSTAAPAAAPASGGGAGGSLAAIRACESGGSYSAVSPSGQYRGAYQFDVQTWQSVGGSGDPAAASPAEQDSRAAALVSQRGSNPWPNCG